MNKKTNTLDLLQQIQNLEREFIEGLSPEEKERSGSYENWSAKDLLGHIVAWKMRMADDLQTVADGDTPSRDDDYEQENARIFKKYQDTTWEEMLETWDTTHRRIVERQEDLSEEDLHSEIIFPWQEGRPLWRLIIGTTYLHPVMHLAEYYRNQGKRTKAGELIGMMAATMETLDDSPHWVSIVKYNQACHSALVGEKKQAIKTLKEALSLNPELREWSQQDPDLENLHGERDFQALYED